MHFSESIHHCFITLCPLHEKRGRDEEETKGECLPSSVFYRTHSQAAKQELV